MSGSRGPSTCGRTHDDGPARRLPGLAARGPAGGPGLGPQGALPDVLGVSLPRGGPHLFTRWFWRATHSRLKPMAAVAKLIQRHLPNLLTYLRHHLTNAGLEGVNAIIQWIKKTARGFRNAEHFKTAIYFHCGGLDLYPHESRKSQIFEASVVALGNPYFCGITGRDQSGPAWRGPETSRADIGERALLCH
ncbi:MAG: transposase [Candidatus Rokuibacteriota bacterium]